MSDQPNIHLVLPSFNDESSGNKQGAFGYASPNIGVQGIEEPSSSDDDDTKELPPIVVADYLDPDLETVSITTKGEHALKMMRERYVKLDTVQQEYRVFMRFVAAMLNANVTHSERRGQVELLGVILKSSLLSLEADANDGIPF